MFWLWFEDVVKHYVPKVLLGSQCFFVIFFTLLPKEALEKAKTDAKMLKTSFWPPLRKGRAVEAIASFPLSCI